MSQLLQPKSEVRTGRKSSVKDEVADQIVAALVERLRQRRLEQGLSVNKVAELAGMSHVGLLQIESGERTPMLRTALKIADALNSKLSDSLLDAGH
jgi:DNA-binding XRE family transcriptional regulator